MANSTYNILEYRCVVHPDRTDIFILIDDPTDFLPIGGWYGKSYAPVVHSLEVLEQALAGQQFLSGDGWTRRAPDDGSKFLQDQVKTLRDELLALHTELARQVHAFTTSAPS